MKTFAITALAAAALTLSGCGDNLGQGPVLHVASGYIEMGATPDRPAAGYFTIEGGPRDVALMAVSSDLAQRVEMHESVKENGVVSMKPLLSAPVPAKGKLEFKPGGKHLMIWNINGAAVRAGKLPMIFVFSNNNNERILFDLTIRQAPGAAGASGAAMDHGAMDMGGAGKAADKGADKGAADAAKK